MSILKVELGWVTMFSIDQRYWTSYTALYNDVINYGSQIRSEVFEFLNNTHGTERKQNKPILNHQSAALQTCTTCNWHTHMWQIQIMSFLITGKTWIWPPFRNKNRDFTASPWVTTVEFPGGPVTYVMRRYNDPVNIWNVNIGGPVDFLEDFWITNRTRPHVLWVESQKGNLLQKWKA